MVVGVVISSGFQKNLIVWKPIQIPFSIPIYSSFQKNLIVWKQGKMLVMPRLSYSFQKNLIVWKLVIEYGSNERDKRVSEELNSVETLEDRMKMKKNKIRFQKNLIVWKRAFLSDRYRPMDKFQKNLIVWKRKSSGCIFMFLCFRRT